MWTSLFLFSNLLGTCLLASGPRGMPGPAGGNSLSNSPPLRPREAVGPRPQQEASWGTEGPLQETFWGGDKTGGSWKHPRGSQRIHGCRELTPFSGLSTQAQYPAPPCRHPQKHCRSRAVLCVAVSPRTEPAVLEPTQATGATPPETFVT